MISIHALCEEGDVFILFFLLLSKGFLSTPSARRATRLHVSESLRNADFYPRPLRGGRRLDAFGLMDVFKISIHALCEEGDRGPASAATRSRYFYPRPLRGGRPCGAYHQSVRHYFYPRPLRGGRPPSATASRPSASYFYPRPLRGGRRTEPSTLLCLQLISIHALCEEGDETDDLNEAIGILFLSTPSARRATSQSSRTTAAMDTFLSTPSARRAT